MSTNTPPASTEGLLNIEEACRYLGGVHRTTLSRLANSGRVTHVKLGRRILFRPAALDEYIAQHERPATVRRRRSA